jgi:hypothetical protein
VEFSASYVCIFAVSVLLTHPVDNCRGTINGDGICTCFGGTGEGQTYGSGSGAGGGGHGGEGGNGGYNPAYIPGSLKNQLLFSTLQQQEEEVYKEEVLMIQFEVTIRKVFVIILISFFQVGCSGGLIPSKNGGAGGGAVILRAARIVIRNAVISAAGTC